MRSFRAALLGSSLSAASALLVSCASPGQAVPDSLWNSSPEPLRERNPSDVAVLPVVDETGRAQGSRKDAPPLAVIREAAYEELLSRRYSALSLSFVDHSVGVAEASASGVGAAGEDAALRIVLQRFDDSDLERDPSVRIAAECYLHDGKTGEVIWSSRAFRTVSLRVEAKTLHDPSLLRQIAAERFVRYMLGGLPVRAIRPAG
jgi:hypothetical protein